MRFIDKKIVFWAGMLSLATTLGACQGKQNMLTKAIEKSSKMENKAADSLSSEAESVKQAVAYTKQDTTHYLVRPNLDAQRGRRFIRTATIKAKTQDVRRTSLRVEDLVMKYRGFVGEGNLVSHIQRHEETPLSRDSLLITRFYVVENAMNIRVPVVALDSFLRELNPLLQFIDQRRITAEDVALMQLANQLTQLRARTADATLRRLSTPSNITDAEALRLNQEAQADAAKIENMRLDDQVAYATIALTLYQRETIFREVVSNYQEVNAYRPSFGWRMGEAFFNGTEVFLEAIIFITNFWLFALVGILGYFGFRRWRRTAQNK